jgi:Tfp pilus assembly protein PilP
MKKKIISTFLAAISAIFIGSMLPTISAGDEAPAPATSDKSSGSELPPPAPTQSTVPESKLIYKSNGNKDPFITSNTDEVTASKNEIENIPISELVLTGIMKGGMGEYAMVSTTTKKAFKLKVNDKLKDGSVKEIGDNFILLEQVKLDESGGPIEKKEIKLTLHNP